MMIAVFCLIETALSLNAATQSTVQQQPQPPHPVAQQAYMPPPQQYAMPPQQGYGALYPQLPYTAYPQQRPIAYPQVVPGMSSVPYGMPQQSTALPPQQRVGMQPQPFQMPYQQVPASAPPPYAMSTPPQSYTLPYGQVPEQGYRLPDQQRYCTPPQQGHHPRQSYEMMPPPYAISSTPQHFMMHPQSVPGMHSQQPFAVPTQQPVGVVPHHQPSAGILSSAANGTSTQLHVSIHNPLTQYKFNH